MNFMEKLMSPIRSLTPAERSKFLIRRGISLTLFVVVFASGLLVGRTSVGDSMAKTAKKAASVIKNRDARATTKQQIDFQQFWNVWSKVQEKYVKRPADEQQMFYGAIAGMVASLGDPYSVYFTPDIAKQFQEELDGSFSGIGAEVGLKNNRIVIVSPLSESPAEAAGILPGDYVVEINGQSTTGLSVEQAVKQIRGPQGTQVTLTIEREGASGTTTPITITRRKIELKSVTHQFLPDNTILITLTSFNEQTMPQFNAAVTAATAKKASSIILDLRNNPGGYFETSIAVASEWLATRQSVVAEREGSSNTRREFYTTGNHRLRGVKTAVLINNGSASASEIVAGALQDHGAAKVIGVKSFGKGSVQEYEELSDGSALKLTVALWYTPNDRSINEQGIQPDIVIEEKKLSEKEATEAIIAARKDPLKDEYVKRALQYLKTGK